MTAYQMAINNVANYIKYQDTNKPEKELLTAFDASEILSIAFCKDKTEIVLDIVRAVV